MSTLLETLKIIATVAVFLLVVEAVRYAQGLPPFTF